MLTCTSWDQLPCDIKEKIIRILVQCIEQTSHIQNLANVSPEIYHIIFNRLSVKLECTIPNPVFSSKFIETDIFHRFGKRKMGNLPILIDKGDFTYHAYWTVGKVRQKCIKVAKDKRNKVYIADVDNSCFYEYVRSKNQIVKIHTDKSNIYDVVSNLDKEEEFSCSPSLNKWLQKIHYSKTVSKLERIWIDSVLHKKKWIKILDIYTINNEQEWWTNIPVLDQPNKIWIYKLRKNIENIKIIALSSTYCFMIQNGKNTCVGIKNSISDKWIFHAKFDTPLQILGQDVYTLTIDEGVIEMNNHYLCEPRFIEVFEFN